MVEVTTSIMIKAPIERCFDLARDIDVHTRTVWKHTREQAVAGVTTGCIGAGELVTFEATHFGIRQRLTSKITDFNAPYLFVDETQKGAFKYLRHVHMFERHGEGTLMTDTLRFEAPLGWLGWIAERLVLKSYMTKFLEHRNEQLKLLAEA
ncbi:SRPBCC family protein [Bacillus sp. FJAT-26390]|uniref:SRPBCC family protein n=1 Tax=Bacillus sp. FJAT-26390 TaxID=1743142 RepID=UPI0006A760E1|nr:SRPBCC family protein [Bacillus sp. FJAT-26390]OBZ17075.1 cell division protein [Bacillus sp. FJAT-26390]